MKDNIIIGIIEIKSDNLEQKIINAYENFGKKDTLGDSEEMKVCDKEIEEIKDCEIFINDEKIPFTYYHKFPKEGNYIIKIIDRY